VTFFYSETAISLRVTVSLHDALPIYRCKGEHAVPSVLSRAMTRCAETTCCADDSGRWMRPLRSRTASLAMNPVSNDTVLSDGWRSEEHTSELQSRLDLVCRLLLQKKI